MRKHTPGPWVAKGSEVLAHFLPYNAITGDDSSQLCATASIAQCAVSWLPSEQTEANANLIAAAPELLAAAKRAVAALVANGAPNCEAAKECKAAIATAEGRES